MSRCTGPYHCPRRVLLAPFWPSPRGGIIVSPAYTYKECVKYCCSMRINPDLKKLCAQRWSRLIFQSACNTVLHGKSVFQPRKRGGDRGRYYPGDTIFCTRRKKGFLPKYSLGRVSVITVISSYLEFKGYSAVPDWTVGVANGMCETARLVFFFASPRHFDFLVCETKTSKCFECERETFRVC